MLSAVSSRFLRILDSTARDGIQGLTRQVPTKTKIGLVDLLTQAGVPLIDVTSVTKTPQMQDAEAVYKGINKNSSCRYWILAPNLYGYHKAYSWGCRHMGLICSASDKFSLENVKLGIKEAYEQRHLPFLELAKQSDISVRAYVSCVFGWEKSDDVSVEDTIALMRKFYEFPNVEIMVCDTNNKGTPERVSAFFKRVQDSEMQINRFGIHFHGQGQSVLDKIEASVAHGIRDVETSLSGFGGCPAAMRHMEGDLSNAPTELVVDWAHQNGFETGIDLDKLLEARVFLSEGLTKEH